MDLETLKPLVEKYIGSIPTSKHVLKFTDDKLRTAKGKVVNDFRTPMLQPKVSEFLLFSSDADYTLRNKQTMLLLNMALNNRYLKSIREEKGGTYGVQVSYTLSYRPENRPSCKYSSTPTRRWPTNSCRSFSMKSRNRD